MTFFQQYIDLMNKADADKVVLLFAEDVVFNDGGGRPFGFADFYQKGRENLHKAFAAIWAEYKCTAKIIKENPASMEYDVYLDDLVLPCIGAATFNEEGLVCEYIVRPR